MSRSRRSRLALTSTAAAAILVLTVGHAAAAPSLTAEAKPEDSRRLADEAMERGRSFLRDGLYEQALREFLVVRDLAPSPRVTAHIGQAEHALQRWVDAEQHLQEALSASADAWVEKNHPSLEKWLGEVRQHIGSLDVQGTPRGARVAINGQAIDLLPFARPLRLPEGRLDLEITAPGYTPFDERIDLRAFVPFALAVHLPKLGESPSFALDAPKEATSTRKNPGARRHDWLVPTVAVAVCAVGAGIAAIAWHGGHDELGPGVVASGTGGILGAVLAAAFAPDP